MAAAAYTDGVTNPTHGSLRVTRAAVFGAAAFALSWAAHVAAGGSSPGVGALVLLGVLTSLGAALVTRWRLGPTPLVVTLGLAQVALHESLMWLASPSPGTCGQVLPCGSAMPAMTMPGMTMPGMTMPAMTSPGSVLARVAMHPAGATSMWMLVAHAAATVVLALTLSVGERALWFLATLLRPVVRVRPALAVVADINRVPVHRHSVPTGPLPFVRGGTGRRGPPRGLIALAV